MAFPKTGFKIFGYLLIGIVFYLTLFLINPWHFELTFKEILDVMSDLAVTLLGVVLIMEAGFIITKKLDIYLPWKSSLTKRILIQVAVQIILVIFVFFILQLLIPDLFTDVTSFRQTFVLGIMLSILFSAIFTASSFFMKWNKASVEIAKYEKKVAKAELEFLKMQISPHFLFNNFSTLTSLIEEDQQLAVEYVQRLSAIYRHVLKDEVEHIVPLKDELDFIDSYLFLYKTRYQESLIVDIRIPSNIMNKGIATATMQLLVENAIKHNSISRSTPLRIDIFSDNDSIIIQNNINPMVKVVESSGIGLKNIADRYLLLSDKTIKITHTASTFRVEVPILDKK